MPIMRDGSAGMKVSPDMEALLQKPGFLKPDDGGQALHRLYQINSLGMDPHRLTQFGLFCFIGNLEGVRKAVESGNGPDLTGTESVYRYGYATWIVSGSQRVRSDEPGEMDHIGVLRYLLAHGMPADVPDIVGYTALFHTMLGAHRPALARVLLEAGANPNTQDKWGCVPLLIAFQTNAVEVVELLLEFGAALDIPEADGQTPESLCLTSGPKITAAIAKWRRRRAGEPTPLDEKQCAACQRQDMPLKFCAKCHTARYCSKECQQAHWKTHKPVCQPFTSSNSVTLKPCYEDIGMVMSPSDLSRMRLGYRVAPPPQREMRSAHVPHIPAGQTKHMIIKVQVPLARNKMAPSPEQVGDMMLYNKKRDFVARIRKADRPGEYMRLSNVVMAKGVGGTKAYFAAELKTKDELVIKIEEVLAEQPW